MPAIWLNLAIAGRFLRRPRMSLRQLTLMGREDDALKVETIVRPILPLVSHGATAEFTLPFSDLFHFSFVTALPGKIDR